MAAKRTLAATLFMTLDGVVEAPDKWSFPFWSDETGKFKLDELRATDALPPRTCDVRGVRGRLAGPEGRGGFRGPVQQHAQVRRLEDVEEARMEQLTPHQGRSGGGSLEAQTAAGPRHRDPRESDPHPIAPAARPDRRVSFASLSDRTRPRKASLRRSESGETEARRIGDVQQGRRQAGLPAR